MEMAGWAAVPSNNPKFTHTWGPTTSHLITNAAALRLGDFLHRRIRLTYLLQTSIKHIYCHGHGPKLKDVWHKWTIDVTGFNILQWSQDVLSGTHTNLLFFNADESRREFKQFQKSSSKSSRSFFSSERKWTNIFLALNILVYIAQVATDGKLLFWGAKINSLINKGQLWRLITSSFLHANIGHLMVNCYSLNSVGPGVEKISGPRRYVALYLTSAIASSAMSYWLSKAPAVGASGAISGLVGSFAVFVLRHRGMVKGTEGDLRYIANVIVLNMAIGLLNKGIDNWGHLGGLIGGAAASWLLGPAWKIQSISSEGRRVFADTAPIFSIVRTKRDKS
ncbi:RHOMBOID-like protein 10, chloroplastic [Nicotiana sylvestris]|uniref:Rhomboid-like protease 2 n=1 Tax=Nicotiana sylvestris TaxID=4096 RepID=A0A1U7Y8B2_NICSY|nr:PREDICTED: rhomboid-like protease 2 [Nicotiana sylvestris]